MKQKGLTTNSVKGSSIFKKIILIAVLVLLLYASFCAIWYYWLGRNIDLTYTSSKLGVSFKYQPITNSGEAVVIKESGNKIYVFTSKESVENSAYVEVVNLEKSSNIQENMQTYIIQNFKKDDCFQAYNMQGVYKDGNKWDVICGIPDGTIRHQDYFLYDKNNPHKFAFFNIDYFGKNGFVSSKDWVGVTGSKFWFSTFVIR